MASLAFQPYVDKENAGPTGVRGMGQAGGGLGKVFNKGNEFAAPRRALGDVGNKAIIRGSTLKNQKPAVAPMQSKGLKIKCTNVQPLASRSGNVIQKTTPNAILKKKVQCSSKFTTKVEPIIKKRPDVADIENMHIPEEEDDDFEDIWPKADRISTYIKKLVTWRPPCIFGDLPDSEEEEDEETRQKKSIEELDRILEASVANHSMKNSELCAEEFPEIELVSEDFEDIPLPCLSLDSSLDLTPNIGPLELKEQF